MAALAAKATSPSTPAEVRPGAAHVLYRCPEPSIGATRITSSACHGTRKELYSSPRAVGEEEDLGLLRSGFLGPEEESKNRGGAPPDAHPSAPRFVGVFPILKAGTLAPISLCKTFWQRPRAPA